jgi:putative phage-type endonuclease
MNEKNNPSDASNTPTIVPEKRRSARTLNKPKPQYIFDDPYGLYVPCPNTNRRGLKMSEEKDEEIDYLLQQMIETQANDIFLQINEHDTMFNDLYECSLIIFNTYIEAYPLHFADENFDDLLHISCQHLLNITIQEMFAKKYSDYVLNTVSDEIMNLSYREFYTNFSPKRSYEKTFVRSSVLHDIIENKINMIKNKPQPEQRTPEWFEFRHNLITASSAGKIFESLSSINQIIYEKCSPMVDRSNMSNMPVNTSSPLHWGQKYEPVSILFYEHKYNTKVEDFGCIQHDKYKFLGASPDGIITDKNSNLHGRMLEIKNVVSRVITGIPKKMYWIQMQLQMETCDLNDCDFLECQFKEYPDQESFNNDGDFKYTENEQLKGIILYFEVDNRPIYEYMPLTMKEDEYNIWKNEMMGKYDKFMKVIYWKLDNYSCILVLRNTQWFDAAIIEIEKVWNTIIYEKETGFEHRAPKKRKKRANSIENQECLIDLNQLDNDDQVKCLIDLDLDIDEIIIKETDKEKEKEQTQIPENTQITDEVPKILKFRTLSIDETNIDDIPDTNIDNV